MKSSVPLGVFSWTGAARLAESVGSEQASILRYMQVPEIVRTQRQGGDYLTRLPHAVESPELRSYSDEVEYSLAPWPGCWALSQHNQHPHKSNIIGCTPSDTAASDPNVVGNGKL